ncbi:hypothetical protein QBC45DRAFT_46829 [Copromyces sp. CBS 386.78]|nr:hypothetical protein QBC45DRAFT_46829 [Copromyces sp. CBS 386.78]
MLFLPPVIDYGLEKICEGCIEEERELVGRAMSLKRAIEEKEEKEEKEEEDREDDTGDGEVVPIRIRVEVGLRYGSAKTKAKKANDDGDCDSDASADTAELKLSGARYRPGSVVSEQEPSHLPELPWEIGKLEIEKPVHVVVSVPATGHGDSEPSFLPPVDDLNERKRMRNGIEGDEGVASTCTSERFGGQAVLGNDQQQYARCKWSQPCLQFFPSLWSSRAHFTAHVRLQV